MSPGFARRGSALALLALGLVASGPAAAGEVGFVYVEGNVGGASGGHAALRLADRAVHYQLADGVLRLVREDWDYFRYRYGTLENRPIHVARVEVDADAERRLRDGFAARYLAEAARRREVAARRADGELAAAWALGNGRVEIPAAGLVDPAAPGDRVARALRAQVAARFGDGFLAAEAARVERALAGTREPQRIRERLAEREALAALLGAWAVPSEAWVEPHRSGAAGALSGRARARLEAHAATTADSVVALLRSTRPDRGRALLVALSRYQALVRSAGEGRLRFVDAMPDEAPRLDARAAALRRRELEALAARLRLVFDAVRRERLESATAAPLGTATYVRLEELASRLHEVDRGARAGAPVREPDGRLTPSRSRAVPVAATPPGVDPERLLEALRARERSAERRLSQAGAYALVTRNCVTELVRTAVDVLGGPEEAERALGGRIQAGEGAGFIPFVFFDQVSARLSPRVTRLAPWRERALAAARARADDARWIDLRESNTLTSRLYTLRDRDSRFLLFTDGIFWRRPLYGAVNTVWALTDVATGLVTAPADRGRRLLRGGYGVIYSLPELAFFNVRKGSFDAATLPGNGLLEAVDAVAATGTAAGRDPIR